MHTEKIGIEIENWKKKIVKFIQLSKKVIEVLKDMQALPFSNNHANGLKVVNKRKIHY
jgi:hypothetical protein